MNARTVGYWTATTLTALAFLAGGTGHLLHAEPVLQGLAALGYPAHLATFLGACKLAGALTILAPGLPRAKEWAYAGIALNLSAAVFAHIAVGDPAGKAIAPLAILAFAAISWALRPQTRRLGPALFEPTSSRTGASGAMEAVTH